MRYCRIKSPVEPLHLGLGTATIGMGVEREQSAGTAHLVEGCAAGQAKNGKRIIAHGCKSRTWR
jgi:hypothetical protein